MIVAAYARVSTTEQVNEGYSLDEQAERLQKYCSAMGWDLLDTYIDGGFSGSNIRRPALQRLISDVKAGKVEKVVVWKLDRLSRSQKDTLYLIEDVFLANNCDFVSMNENFDTSTPFGKAMIGILAVFAQLEREQIKERMAMGKDAKAQMGFYHGYGNIPTGYDYKEGKLVVNEFEAMIIKRMFELYASGHGYAIIADELNNAGLKPRFGEWSRRTVRTAIHNQTYIGKIPHRGEWLDGNHEPIISQELFDRATNQRERKVVQYRNQPISGRVNSLLAGLIVCGHCGARYGKISKLKKTVKSGPKRYNKYCCNSRSKRTECLIFDPNCKNKIWDMEVLDEVIIREVEKLALNPDLIQISAQKVQKSDEIEPIKDKLKALDTQISKLMDLYSVEQMPYNVLQQKILDLSQQREKLQENLSAIEQEQPKSLSKEVVWENVCLFSKVARNGTYDDLRAILFLLIDKIVLDGEDVLIHWNF